MNTLLISTFDTFRPTLKNLHPDDRLGAVARMMGRPDLLGNKEFRSSFYCWIRGVTL